MTKRPKSWGFRVLAATAVLALGACSHGTPSHADQGPHGGGPPAPSAAPMQGMPGMEGMEGMPGMDHAAHTAVGAPTIPSGYAPVMLDPARLDALGLTTAKAEHRMFDKIVRTVGVVTLDETRTAHVHAKVRGFIDSIQVDFVG